MISDIRMKCLLINKSFSEGFVWKWPKGPQIAGLLAASLVCMAKKDCFCFQGFSKSRYFNPEFRLFFQTEKKCNLICTWLSAGESHYTPLWCTVIHPHGELLPSPRCQWCPDWDTMFYRIPPQGQVGSCGFPPTNIKCKNQYQDPS